MPVDFVLFTSVLCFTCCLFLCWLIGVCVVCLLVLIDLFLAGIPDYLCYLITSVWLFCGYV